MVCVTGLTRSAEVSHCGEVHSAARNGEFSSHKLSFSEDVSVGERAGHDGTYRPERGSITNVTMQQGHFDAI